MEEFVKVPTGIPGLDELIGGGLLKGSAYLVAGEPGAGKTIFGCQFLVKGIELYGENGVLVTLEEPPSSIARNAKLGFGWDLADLIAQGRLKIVDASIARPADISNSIPTKVKPFTLSEFLAEDFYQEIQEAVREVNATRVVIDPITILGSHFKEPFEVRKEIFGLSRVLDKMGCTSLLTSEIVRGSQAFGRYGVEEFTTDGVIILYMLEQSTERIRAVEVRKMRGVSHTLGLRPFEINADGITVHLHERVIGRTPLAMTRESGFT
ncbi:MAG: ATPase domain-containing protein [Promethearchaeati archaeon SRVP18_Atabeyarchaeia-1]